MSRDATTKGGPGSGENEGHPFRGNQWTSGNMRVSAPDMEKFIDFIGTSKASPAALAGGVFGSGFVSVNVKSPSSIRLMISSPDGSGERIVSKTEDGKLTLRNENFESKLPRGSSVGAKMLLTQLKACADVGISRIETVAATVDTYERYGIALNGAYTWARLGYNNSDDIPLELSPASVPEEIRDIFGASVTDGVSTTYIPAGSIKKLMSTSVGRDWWKKHSRTFKGYIDVGDKDVVDLLNDYLSRRTVVKGGPGSGERDGHPFRGNQWTSRASSGDAPDRKPRKAPAAPPERPKKDTAPKESRSPKQVGKVKVDPEAVLSRTSSIIRSSHLLNGPGSGSFLRDMDVYKKIGEDAAVRMSKVAGGLSTLGSDYFDSAEGDIFKERVDTVSNTVASVATAYAEFVALAESINKKSVYDEFEKFLKDELGVTGFNGENIESIVTPEAFFKLVESKSHDESSAPLVHMTSSTGAVQAMVANGIQSYSSLAERAKELAIELKKAEKTSASQISKIKEELVKAKKSGGSTKEIESRLAKASDKFMDIQRKLNAVGVKGNTYKGDQKAGLDKFVFMSNGHSDAEYGEFGVIIDGSLKGESSTWATRTDIARIGTSKEVYGSYSDKTLSSYRGSIVNGSGIGFLSAAQSIVKRSDFIASQGAKGTSRNSSIEVKAPSVDKSKVLAAIVKTSADRDGLVKSGFKGDVLWKSGGHFMLNGKKLSNGTDIADAIKAYHKLKSSSKVSKRKCLVLCSDIYLVKGGPGSGPPDGHSFRGNQYTDSVSNATTQPSGFVDVKDRSSIPDVVKQREKVDGEAVAVFYGDGGSVKGSVHLLGGLSYNAYAGTRRRGGFSSERQARGWISRELKNKNKSFFFLEEDL